MNFSLPYFHHLCHLVPETWWRVGVDVMWKVPLCTAQPAHESSLATYSLHGLRLATASISTSLTIMWRQCSFLPWLQRSNTRRADSMFSFSSLPFPTWESALVWGSGNWSPQQKKPWLEGERLCMLPAGWTVLTQKGESWVPDCLFCSKITKTCQKFSGHCSDTIICHFTSPQANPVT